MERHCESCRFFDLKWSEGDKYWPIHYEGTDQPVRHNTGGLCRRSAPHLAANPAEHGDAAWWPQVLSTDWCGEHMPKIKRAET